MCGQARHPSSLGRTLISHFRIGGLPSVKRPIDTNYGVHLTQVTWRQALPSGPGAVTHPNWIGAVLPTLVRHPGRPRSWCSPSEPNHVTPPTKPYAQPSTTTVTTLVPTMAFPVRTLGFGLCRVPRRKLTSIITAITSTNTTLRRSPGVATPWPGSANTPTLTSIPRTYDSSGKAVAQPAPKCPLLGCRSERRGVRRRGLVVRFARLGIVQGRDDGSADRHAGGLGPPYADPFTKTDSWLRCAWSSLVHRETRLP